MNGINQAVAKFNGNMSELARQIGVTPQAVQQWVRSGKVPAARAGRVHELTGVPLHDLNPVFPSQGQAA